MTLVVDASVAFKWFAQENGTDRALHLLECGEPIVAPDLILAEVCNAAWKSLRRGELAPPQFDAILTDIANPSLPPGAARPADPTGCGADAPTRSSDLRLPVSRTGRL